MRGQRRGAFDIAGAERTRDRRRHAAAHGAARHRHGQHHDGKHQRHRGQRLDAEAADIGGLGDHHAGAGGQRDDVGPGQPQQRLRIGPSSSAFFAGGGGAGSGRSSSRREFRRRRYRTFLLPARGLGWPRRGCFLAWQAAIPRAKGATGTGAIAGGPRPPPLGRSGGQLTGNS